MQATPCSAWAGRLAFAGDDDRAGRGRGSERGLQWFPEHTVKIRRRARSTSTSTSATPSSARSPAAYARHKLWRLAATVDAGSPARLVVGGETTGCLRDGAGDLFGIDLATGRRTWRIAAGASIEERPAVAGGLLHALTETGVLG